MENETTDAIDRQFEEAYEANGIFRGATLKEHCKLWWLKGRGAGISEGIKQIDAAMKLAPTDILDAEEIV